MAAASFGGATMSCFLRQAPRSNDHQRRCWAESQAVCSRRAKRWTKRWRRTNSRWGITCCWKSNPPNWSGGLPDATNAGDGRPVRCAGQCRALGPHGWTAARPVIATEQNPSRLGASFDELAAALREARAHAEQMQFGAVEEGLRRVVATRAQSPLKATRSLPRHLQKAAAPTETALWPGVRAHICLLQTALDLLEDEFDVWVVTDACASRTERNRDAAFDRPGWRRGRARNH